MNELITALVGGSVTSALALLIAGYLGREMIATRIKESIAAAFKKEHEKFASDLKWESARRERAALIADVLVSWIALEVVPSKRSNVEAYLELQRKYWELSLWLDGNALRLLNNSLTRQPNSNHKEALAAVRAILVSKEENPIVANDIVHFTLPDVASADRTPVAPAGGSTQRPPA